MNKKDMLSLKGKKDIVINYYEGEIKKLKLQYKWPESDLDPVNDVLTEKIDLISGFILRLNLLLNDKN